MKILQDRLSEVKMNDKNSDKVISIPSFVMEKISVQNMKREELEAEFAKITPDQIEQLDTDSKKEIKTA